MNNLNKKNKTIIRKNIIDWNNKYPIDFLWRKKYGVAFGSPEHRQMSFLDMKFDIEEEIFMRNLANNSDKKQDEKSSMNKIEEDKLFDDLDIDNLDKYMAE